MAKSHKLDDETGAQLRELVNELGPTAAAALIGLGVETIAKGAARFPIQAATVTHLRAFFRERRGPRFLA